MRDILRNFDNVDIQMDEVTSIDLENRSVQTASGNTFAGEFLVLATGSHVNFYGVTEPKNFRSPSTRSPTPKSCVPPSSEHSKQPTATPAM